ncbi:hypothetical protein [Thalassotalea crassostreae]|uniref:hypothetical protein n=1 Tax=Thalassotalea crassostreae TaxID=1763536 RepID=UPI0008384BD8|nr:hypothetical protein [Thalassotalea crassostreae]
MKKFIYLFSMLFAIAFTLNAKAEEGVAADPLTDVWVIKIDAVDKGKFEQALKAHMQYRVDNGDPRIWNVYTQVVGNNMETYVLRACCTNWDKIAEYRDWSRSKKMSSHWRKTVGLYSKNADHYFSRLDDKNSHWDNTKEFRYFGVTSLYPEPGAGFEVRESIKAISDAAKKMGWEESWAWYNQIGGEPQIQLVVGFESYADMMPAEKSYYERLVDLLGDKEKAQDMISDYSEQFDKTNYAIYVHRESLSSPSSKSK